MHITGRTLIAGIAVACLPATALSLSSQYFGRNKVQYEDFRFHVLNTDHFDVYFYPEEEEAARSASLMAERW